MTKIDGHVFDPPVEAKACIIWMHGLGADSADFVGLIEQFNLPSNHGIRFIFPNAPFRNITVNHGMRMRAWYDIYDISLITKEDSAGVQNSEATIANIIKHQIDMGIASEKIILGGFSQGAAMALHTGLYYPSTLAAIVAFSGYLPLKSDFDENSSVANKNTEVFMGHGMFDPVVPYNVGQATCKHLEQLGHTVLWHAYPMAHAVCPDEIHALSIFVRKVLL